VGGDIAVAQRLRSLPQTVLNNMAQQSAINFEQVVHLYYEALYRFAVSLARNVPDACDLTQEAFYRLATKGSALRDPSKAKSWLFTTLHREYLSRRRRENRFPHHEIEESSQELPTVSPKTIEAMEASEVMEFLMELDEPFRAPLVLFYLKDHSYREIADILEIPVGTVMSRLSRAKTMLRKLLTRKALQANSKIVNLSANPTHKTAQS
jgi:RNA polymerase sigma-70 factor (ECF subfamily)